jgi:NitT/TauT family transport system ATP-binding protein
VLLMDEPFNALDEPLRRSLLYQYDQILRQNQLTAILVTHSVEEAIYLGDSIQVISGNPHLGDPGKITYSIQVPFRKPRSPELFRDASFISLKERVLDEFLPSDADLA